MQITFVRAGMDDVEKLVELYRSAFYGDYVRYGYCPAYHTDREKMEKSLQKTIKYLICCDAVPVGVLSVAEKEGGCYHLGCLCVIPQYQHRGIGSAAMSFLEEAFPGWRRITLETPADKVENVAFYTGKCGFSITGTLREESVALYSFEKENPKAPAGLEGSYAQRRGEV